MPVSVVLSVFNAAPFLRECIDSVLAQSVRAFEFVIVDDGSTDGSSQILRDYAAAHDNIVLIQQPNQGISAARNRGAPAARHDLIAVMDADDVMEPTRLERQLAFLSHRPSVAVACSFIRLINSKGEVVGVSRPSFPKRDRLADVPGRFCAFSHSSVMMRKADLLALGGYRDDFTCAVDQELWGRFLTHGCEIAVQREFLMKHRIHSGSVTMHRLRQQHHYCEFVYTNLARSARGEEILSLAEFDASQQCRPFYQTLAARRELLWQLSYKRATRVYAEGQASFMRYLGLAFLLNPVRTVHRIIAHREGA